MSVNSSSNSSLPFLKDCHDSRTSVSIFTAFAFTYYILLLPLVFLVLFIGWKRWRKQRSVANAPMTSHSDIITFNMVVVELIGVLACFLYCFGNYSKSKSPTEVVMEISFSIWSLGQNLFHLLTCVDRYLAVVHPIAYLWLRQRGGVRIRNISIVCVWLLCFQSVVAVLFDLQNFYIILSFLVFCISFVIIAFCSLSVLCVLIRPGPGEVGGNRGQVDQSKLRAFKTITAILGVLLLGFLNPLISLLILHFLVFNPRATCLLAASVCWFSLPSSLVLPLLFLHRAGKLPGCKRNTESG